jgi:hypothetical protein
MTKAKRHTWERCPACDGLGPVAIVVLGGNEYGLCRECVLAFTCAHARLARELNKPRK